MQDRKPNSQRKTGLVPETDKKKPDEDKSDENRNGGGKASDFGNDYDINPSRRPCCLDTTSIPSADSMENSVHLDTCDRNQNSNGDSGTGSGPDHRKQAHTLEGTATPSIKVCHFADRSWS